MFGFFFVLLSHTNTFQGWIECVGHADRSAYDLTVHGQCANNARLTVFIPFAQPVVKKVLSIKADKGKIGRAFKGGAQAIIKFFETRDEAEVKTLQEQMASGYDD